MLAYLKCKLVKWQTSYLHVCMLTLAFTLKYNLINLIAWLETLCKAKPPQLITEVYLSKCERHWSRWPWNSIICVISDKDTQFTALCKDRNHQPLSLTSPKLQWSCAVTQREDTEVTVESLLWQNKAALMLKKKTHALSDPGLEK